MNKIKWLQVIFLLIIMQGSLFFLISMAYFNEGIMLMSLVSLMCGSCGFFYLDHKPITPNIPPKLIKEKMLKRR